MNSIDGGLATIAKLARERRPGYALPGPLYSDPEVYAADLEIIFRRGWMMACHSCQIAKPGDYVLYDMEPDSLILLRDDGGRVRAFYNTCRHRGSLLCSQASGHIGRLVCPYHQWTYSREGRLLGCGGMPDELDKATLGLAEAPAEEVAGLVFVSFGDEPSDFQPAREVLEPQLLPQGMADARVACLKEYVIEANWKLVWENNRECLHCPVGHPQYVKANYDIAMSDDPAVAARIERRSTESEARWEALGLRVGHREGGLTPFPDKTWYRANRTPLIEGWVSESIDGRPVAPLMGQYTERDMGTLRISTLPNFWNHSSSDHAVSTRLTPAGPKRTLAQVIWLVHRDAVEGVDYRLEDLLPFWQLTSEQDWVLCAENQRGVDSRHFRPGPYSESKEYNVDAFVRWYLDQMVL